MRLSLSFLLLAAAALYAESWATPVKQVGPDIFPIMAWSGSPADPAALREMKAAGLNVSGFCKVAELDAVRDAGLTCFVEDPAIGKLIGKGSATDAEINAAVAALAPKIANHPAALGVNLRDEPSVEQMPLLGRIAAALMKAMPSKIPYVNLFPNYASRTQLKAENYDAYLTAHIKTIKLPFLSWDNYSLRNGTMHQNFFDNLESVRRITLEYKIPFWNCVLANTLFQYMEPSDATFAIQAYSTMAYGGRGIEYFTYFTPDIGNFRLAPIDQWGNKTATWDMLRRINNQIHMLAPTLTKLRSTGVYHWPVSTSAGTPLIDDLKTSNQMLVGEFVDDQGRPYVMLVNKDLKESAKFTVVTKAKDTKIFRISQVTGKEGDLGGEGNWLAPGAGVLFRIEAK